MGPKADHAGVAGWIVMFNTSTRGSPMDWTERKGKTKKKVWDMGKSNRSPLIKARKEVEGTDGERGGRESMQTQGREVIPIHPTQCHHSGGKGARPSLCRSGYIKLTLHRLPGNGASPRLQQVSYT